MNVKTVFQAMIDTLEADSELSPILSGYKVWPFLAFHRASIQPGKITVFATVGDSGGQEPIDVETADLPTTITLTLATSLKDDDSIYTGDFSILDVESTVYLALQTGFWSSRPQMCGWRVAAIRRDVPLLDGEGNIDPEIYICEIDLEVKVQQTRAGVDF